MSTDMIDDLHGMTHDQKNMTFHEIFLIDPVKCMLTHVKSIIGPVNRDDSPTKKDQPSWILRVIRLTPGPDDRIRRGSVPSLPPSIVYLRRT